MSTLSKVLARGGLAIVIVLGASLAAAPIARAAPPDKRELDARADYAAGRYQKAIDTFAALFADTADPVFLRNIGRCYQKMKRPLEAIDSFQDYLHKARNLSRGERQEIEGYIKEMEALKQSEAATAPAPAPPPAPATPAAPPPIEATPPLTLAAPPTAAAGTMSTAPPPAPGGDPRTWRIAGIATAAGGVVLIGVGVAFGLAARSAADSVSQQYSAGTESDGNRDVKLQWIGYGVGAAAVTAGALLYLHGLSPTEILSARRASLRGRATASAHGGGLLLEGVF